MTYRQPCKLLSANLKMNYLETYIFFVKLLGTMREENGIIEIERAIDKLSRHHIRHIKVHDRCICGIIFCNNLIFMSGISKFGLFTYPEMKQNCFCSVDTPHLNS